MMNRIKNNLNVKDQITPHDYWQVSRSGKVLELRVTPSIDKNPNHYRLGVIQIGRIIQRIKSLESQSKTEPQIHSFPNLAENQLAATIYWPQLLNTDIHITPQKKGSEPCSPAFLCTLLNKYSLILKKDFPEITLLQNNQELSRFSLLSHTNQPFVWLKLGQFIQEFKETASCGHQISVKNVKLDKPGKSETNNSSDNLFLQAHLHLPDNIKDYHPSNK